MRFSAFRDSEDKYIAAGNDQSCMSVYEVAKSDSGTFVLSPLPMRFPACLRFLGDVEGEGPVRRSLKSIEHEYGTLPLLPEEQGV